MSFLNDRVIWVLAAALVVMTLMEWLWFPHGHAVFAWHDWPGYTVAIAVAAALVVGWVTKTWLAPLLQVREDPDE